MPQRAKTKKPSFEPCSHPIHDQVEMLMQVEIKDFVERKKTVSYRYRCQLHSGKSGCYTVEMSL